MPEPSTGDALSLRSKINDGLREAICDEEEVEPTANLLYDLVVGKKSVGLVSKEIHDTMTKSKDPDTYIFNLSTEIVFQVCEYPFLQPQLVCLLRHILRTSNDFNEQLRSQFETKLMMLVADTTRANYGVLFEESRRDQDLISDHVHLNRFLARLLFLNPEERISDIDDALFILATAFEGHPDSHNAPEIDIPAAAQYMIHAGELFHKECINLYGHNLFGDHLRDKGVLWNIKGPLFTGEPGLTRQRWDFWRSRLQAMESSGATRETKQVALAAVQAMSHVETSQL